MAFSFLFLFFPGNSGISPPFSPPPPEGVKPTQARNETGRSREGMWEGGGGKDFHQRKEEGGDKKCGVWGGVPFPIATPPPPAAKITFHYVGKEGCLKGCLPPPPKKKSHNKGRLSVDMGQLYGAVKKKIGQLMVSLRFF